MKSPSIYSRLVGIGISKTHASHIASGTRPPSLALSLRIYDELRLKVGPIAKATPNEIAALKRVAATQAVT